MGALALPAGAAAVGAFLCLAAAWLWLTQGAPAATKFIEGVRQSIDEAFSESEPSPIEDCPLSREAPVEPSGPPPELPPGGTPEPPIDVTLPITVAVAAAAASVKTAPQDDTSPADETENGGSDDPCKNMRAAILEKYAKLGKELRKYDPILDAKGGFRSPRKATPTVPCGHYMKIKDFQRGLKNDLTKFQKECSNSAVKIDRNVDRMANAVIERPPGC